MNDINRVAVLDHGFVILRNMAGPTRRLMAEGSEWNEEQPDGSLMTGMMPAMFDADDRDPANAARMSFDATDSGRALEEDMRLAKYLMKNWHTSPFEQVQVWLEMKLPIFVARQFVRHRTVRLNEVSGRYVTLPAEWYIPAVVGGKAKDRKQGQEDNLGEWVQTKFQMDLQEHCRQGYAAYLRAIGEGVAAEHARLLLSLNHYTHWLWNQDLHNLMHFLSLRLHEHAQVEARAYAAAIYNLVGQVLPRTMELFDEYRRRT